MIFNGLSSSAQATRGYWRIVLEGDVFDLGFFLTNPLEKWPAKVERWRAAVNAGKADVPAVCSTAAIAGTEVYDGRAVVDVHVLGADSGDTVGAVARRLHDLVTNVDVLSVTDIEKSDPISRDVTLKEETDKPRDPFKVDRILSLLELLAGAAIVIGAVYVVAKAAEANK
jgi:hypothetical protein